MSIYQKYCRETFDDRGRLCGFEIDCPPDFNFGYDVVDVCAAEEPEKTALVWCGAQNEARTFTFADISKYSNQAANVLAGAGIGKGDRVMVILKRHYEYWFVAIALHKLGAVMIPATHMLTVSDLEYRIGASKAKAIICTPQDGVPDNVRQALRSIDVSPLLWSVRCGVDGFRNLTAEMRLAHDRIERVPTCADEPMLMYFTSGTTGEPKGVLHDYSYPLAHVVTAKYWQQAEEGGLHFTVAETGWAKASWGKLYGQWLVGSAVMVYDFDSFDPKQLTSIINRFGVTSFCAPPTVYRYLVRREIPPMPTLKHASTAGEKLTPDVFQRFTERTSLSLCEGYGQTETALLMGNLSGYAPAEGSMGIASPMYRIELRDKHGAPTPRGEIGEIVIVPPENGRQIGIFCGYLDNEAQYRHVWRGGVYHTGDAAWQDEEGHFRFHGRFDDIIKTGGFRVGPSEIENVLSAHPDVLECSVIGIPDALRGQAIKAVVLLRAGVPPTKELEQSIKEYCNAQLAEYKWIRSVEFIEQMPKTVSGKIRKTELRARSEGAMRS